MGVKAPVRLRRTYRGFTVSGFGHIVTLKWLHAGTRAIAAGVWYWQAGRFLIRVTKKLRPCR